MRKAKPAPQAPTLQQVAADLDRELQALAAAVKRRVLTAAATREPAFDLDPTVDAALAEVDGAADPQSAEKMPTATTDLTPAEAASPSKGVPERQGCPQEPRSRRGATSEPCCSSPRASGGLPVGGASRRRAGGGASASSGGEEPAAIEVEGEGRRAAGQRKGRCRARADGTHQGVYPPCAALHLVFVFLRIPPELGATGHRGWTPHPCRVWHREATVGGSGPGADRQPTGQRRGSGAAVGAWRASASKSGARPFLGVLGYVLGCLPQASLWVPIHAPLRKEARGAMIFGAEDRHAQPKTLRSALPRPSSSFRATIGERPMTTTSPSAKMTVLDRRESPC
jgi:hypothetical protein